MAPPSSPSQGLPQVFVAGAVRTPVGAVGGALSPLVACELATLAIRGVIEQTGLDPAEVQYTGMGQVIQDPRATNLAKIAAERAGIPETVPATTFQENCASGAASIHDLARRIRLGEVELGVAGGTESMSNVPRFLYDGRTRARLYGDYNLEDGLMGTLLERELEGGELMGLMTERLVRRWGVERELQDEIAWRSHHNARAAWEAGRFDDYVLPVEVPRKRRDPLVVRRDEGPRDLQREDFARARPYFDRENGTVTSLNASSINDAAAAVVLASEPALERLGLRPLARLVAWHNLGVERAYMGEGAFKVIPPLLERAGLALSDVDFVEMNEAFAAVVGAAMHFLPDLGFERLNRWGSGISLGHPVGCTGARQLCDMIHQLPLEGGRTGLTCRCVGGGMGSGEVVQLVEE